MNTYIHEYIQARADKMEEQLREEREANRKLMLEMTEVRNERNQVCIYACIFVYYIYKRNEVCDQCMYVCMWSLYICMYFCLLCIQND